MSLYVSLAAAPGAPACLQRQPARELVIDTSMVRTGASLLRYLRDIYGPAAYSVGQESVGSLTPGIPPLCDGAVIVAAQENARRRRRRPAAPQPGLVFVVRSGPDAGQLTALSRGSYTIGRSSGRIVVRDPEISREHAILAVGANRISISDNGSVNGTWVDGSRIATAPVTIDSCIRIGNSLCGIALTDHLPTARVPVNLREPVEVQAPPPPERNRLLLLTALLPLVLGIVLALTTGMWFFLAFSALSAITGVFPLITGRRRRKAFAKAVAAAAETDQSRRRLAAPDAGALALRSVRTGNRPDVRSRGEPGHVATRDDTAMEYLRLGLADQPAALVVKPEPQDWAAPLLSSIPVTIALGVEGGSGHAELTFSGSPSEILGAARYVLLQLSHLGTGGIICFGHPEELPVGAQFLPGVRLMSLRNQLARETAAGKCRTLLLFGAAARTDFPGSRQQLHVLRFGSHNTDTPGTSVILDGGVGRLRRSGQPELVFLPDLMGHRSFERIARAQSASLTVQSANPQPTDVPLQVALDALVRCGTIRVLWSTGPGQPGQNEPPGLRVPIGSRATGPLYFDPVTDGPHVLVAGTTGSGKSELLRTLMLSLALHHSPAKVNFLLIDFKGGSGLGVLDALPHSVGLLTDLSAEAVARALVSLRAEVKRRELLFAQHSATDIAEYLRMPGNTPLPRLIVVIDEFRMLSEEVPGAVQDLMRLATLGRSLGMHLVMATQRPQGAVTADIRANVTACIALRVQTPMDSMDLLDSAVAASIPVSFSGRAYLRIGAGSPIEFQTASTGTMAARTSAPVAELAVHLLGQHHQHNRHTDDLGSTQADSPGPRAVHTGLQAVIDSVRMSAASLPLPPLHFPVLPVLPQALPASFSSSIDADGAVTFECLNLGLLDLPETQSQRTLVWNPELHSHLALIGQPSGGTSQALAHVACQLLTMMRQRHLYVLDGEGSLHWTITAPQTGAYAGGHELKRAARILQRISGLIAERMMTGLAEPAPPGLSVIVSGWGRWAGGFRNSRWAWAEEALQDIARDGERAGVVLVITGERELMSGRFFPLVPNRVFLPVGTNAESLMTWPRLPAMDAVAGRGLVQGRISSAGGAVCQMVLRTAAHPAGEDLAGTASPDDRPFRVEALPTSVDTNSLPHSIRAPAMADARIPLGLGGDELETVYLDLPQRSVFLVLGGARSGRTSLLHQVAAVTPAPLTCLRPGHVDDPATYWKELAEKDRAGCRDPENLENPENRILLVDNADQLSSATQQDLTSLHAAGARVILTASAGPSLMSRVPLAMHARSSGLGIVLAPRQLSDGDFFGVRLDWDGRQPPGRGFLLNGTDVLELQVAYGSGGNALKRP